MRSSPVANGRIWIGCSSLLTPSVVAVVTALLMVVAVWAAPAKCPGLSKLLLVVVSWTTLLCYLPVFLPRLLLRLLILPWDVLLDPWGSPLRQHNFICLGLSHLPWR